MPYIQYLLPGSIVLAIFTMVMIGGGIIFILLGIMFEVMGLVPLVTSLIALRAGRGLPGAPQRQLRLRLSQRASQPGQPGREAEHFGPRAAGRTVQQLQHRPGVGFHRPGDIT